VLAAAAMGELSEVWGEINQAAGAAERLGELLAVQSEIKSPSRPVPMPEPPRGEVAFRDVSFRYPSRPAISALNGISFRVRSGERVAIVGPSGAGKTTIANLLLRFWDPEHGGIHLDGVDLRELTLDGLRGRIALVAQDTYLFNNTLEANVRLARPEATREEIETALRQAALADFVAGLPDGLQTKVGERGVQLSGGQRQRIAIARAFLKDAPILVLDEATSHLDTISEQVVRSALDALMTNRTTIIVAHRLSTIQAADLIVVLHAGRVIEAGTHGELTARRGFYARLVDHQMASVAAAN
jgi:ATP-binding cassette subfamily B protein